MIYKVKDSFRDDVSHLIGKKIFADGVLLGGSIDGDKIKLYTTDTHGKHSKFIARTFYGTLRGNTLTGKFFISYFVCFLLGLLAGVCIESIIMAIISDSMSSLVFPIVILAAEIVYLLSIKRISADNDKYIKMFLEDCRVED